MTLKYLTAEKQPTQYFFRVQLDENPENVREYAWGLTPPEGQTETQYLDNIKREISLLVTDELSRINAPTPAPTSLPGF